MTQIHRMITLAVLVLAGVILTGGIFVTPAAGMGMDFGGGSGPAAEAVCTPDENPVIVPGALGSPMRIQAADPGQFLVADYKKRVIYALDNNTYTSPETLFAVAGKPLSVVKAPGRRGAATYWIGNDDSKTIDQYVERRGRIFLYKQLFSRTPVQALDMAFDETTGTIYVVDGLAAEIKVLNTGGRLVRSFGGFGQLVNPKGIALDLVNGEVVVTDYGDSKVGISASIQVFDLDGSHLKTITGSFSRPQGVSVVDGTIYVTDAVLGEVLVFNRDTGALTTSYGCFGTSEGHLLMPMDVALDSGTQELFVADNRNGRITVLPTAP